MSEKAGKLKVSSIKLTLSGDSGEVVTTCERDAEYIWRVAGPVYPKHMKLMAELNASLREVDC